MSTVHETSIDRRLADILNNSYSLFLYKYRINVILNKEEAAVDISIVNDNNNDNSNDKGETTASSLSIQLQLVHLQAVDKATQSSSHNSTNKSHRSSTSSAGQRNHLPKNWRSDIIKFFNHPKQSSGIFQSLITSDWLLYRSNPSSLSSSDTTSLSFQADMSLQVLPYTTTT